MKSKNLALSVMLAIATLVMGTCVKTLAHQTAADHQSYVISQSFQDQAELDAYFQSAYQYCDAEILSSYWGMNLDDTKMRMGRKILWGEADMLILEQFLADAKVSALYALENYPDELCNYGLSRYNYDDAEALAEFWGEPTPWDAKIRIEKNILLNTTYLIDETLNMISK
jgi:hypothetical protein